MADTDPIPKLRVVEDNDSPPESVVRLGREKPVQLPSQRLQPAAVPTLRTIEQSEPAEARPESAARLESATREYFDGRSVEPGVEAILDQQQTEEGIENPWGDRERRVGGIPYGWFILIALALVGAGIWSLLKMKEGEAKVTVAHETVREKVEEDEKDAAAARELVTAVETVVRKYLAAETIEAITPLVRHPKRVGPLIEEAWKSQPKKALKFTRLAMFQPALLDGKTFWVVRAGVESGEPVNLLLEQTGETEVKVDWETQVTHQPMLWDKYIAERPSDKSYDFRVWAVKDTFFSHEFSDSSRWRCFRLTANQSGEHLFGYAAADSEVAKTLDAYCAGAPRNLATVILRLRFLPASGSQRGVVIEKMVEPRWVHAVDPTDAP